MAKKNDRPSVGDVVKGGTRGVTTHIYYRYVEEFTSYHTALCGVKMHSVAVETDHILTCPTCCSRIVDLQKTLSAVIKNPIHVISGRSNGKR